MILRHLLWLVGVSLVPGVELRGSIPLGVGLGLHPLLVFGITVAANCALIPPWFLTLDLFYDRVLSRWSWFRRLMVERVRLRGGGLVHRYGLVGLALFVGVPLPGTGAYSGVALAWLLGVERRGATLAIVAGVLLAGAAVTLAATGILVAIRSLLL
ncbi:MAG: small multi-drug export protein [Armatimonadota bacterium]|nr:small multi-drug export protein [Armatimonadota bacterium]MDR7428284.1 small multi-drug export protein [Armatimonadota bacterium]MDR7469374.1 small multi-drug export protein [Armatimonadota bacterium]MDR7474790.1 small multi-drug export protein [Armatimonadota bacterium]